MTGDQPLRIVIFGESYLPYLSGVTVSTEALARGLRAAGHEVLLVVPMPARSAEPGTAGALGALTFLFLFVPGVRDPEREPLTR